MLRSSRSLTRRLLLSTMALLALGVAAGSASADDIDLYTGAPLAGGQPDLLVMLDNAKAWDGAVSFNCPTAGVVSANNANKDVGFEQCALYQALASIAGNSSLVGKINMGLMMFDPSSNGAKFRYPATPPYDLPTMDAAGVASFQTSIQGIDRQANGANNSAVGGGMQEMWAYFAGSTGLSGTKYKSPLAACQKAFVLYIANAMQNGKPQDGSSSPSAYSSLNAVATSAQMQEISIPLPNNKYQSNWGDEWARFMYQDDLSGGTEVTPQNIVTYTIAVTDGSNPNYVQFLQSMASNGGGKAFVVNINDPNALQELIDALNAVFDEVQAINSVYASVSLPVSVDGQGSYLNQIFVGMFRPDAQARPLWAGNLKQYQLGFDASNNVQLEDKDGKPAINSAGTGFISPTATSFWTEDKTNTADGPYQFTGNSITSSTITDWPVDGFWVNAPAGSAQAFDAPDGEVVEKGGVSEALRADFLTSQDGRVVYTCDSTSSCPTTTAMPLFNTSNASLLTGTALGDGTTSPTASDLIDWMRGTDNSTDAYKQKGPGSPVTVRPSIHADVLHSRPAVVNYGGSTGVVVYYGSNDGVFHAVNGNQTAGITDGTRSVRPGGELWSFVAPEFFGKLKRLYDNTVKLKLAGSTDPNALPKDYFFDGATTVYQDYRVATAKKVYIYMTARRGGRFLYAMDVTSPLSPKFLWKVTTAEIPELGQTWSQPKVALVKGYTNPVLIMGGGYDPKEDDDPFVGPDSMGRAIVVLDAVTGKVVWTAQPSCTGVTTPCAPVTGMTHAIPADITLVDRDADGYMDRLYAADLGGNVWRVDLEPSTGTAPADWAVTQIASLAGTGNGARKFFFPPDVVPTADFDAVLLPSGDREHPMYSASTVAGTAYDVVNRFYMLKDTTIGKSVDSATWTTIKEGDLTDATTAVNGTTTYTKDSASSGGVTSPNRGFFITFGHAGEKGVNAPLTVAGYTYFGTNTPSVPGVSSSICYPNLGVARGYAINFFTGQGLNSNGYVVFSGGGLPPSAVFGDVAITQGGQTVITPVLIGGGNQTGTTGGDSTSALGAQRVMPAALNQRRRTYWYTDGVQ